MTPTINVNLKPCDCGTAHPELYPPTDSQWGDKHQYGCANTPVLIPCSIPRTVEMMVSLGQCDRGCHQRSSGHWKGCEGDPLRVTCSIGGETWAASFADTVDWQTRNERGDWCPSPMSLDEHARALAACRERWEIVKALVLNDYSYALPDSDNLGALLAQRDDVFARLATLASEEEAHAAAYSAAWAAIGRPKAMNMEGRTSATIFGEYVERLIEQVMTIGEGV